MSREEREILASPAFLVLYFLILWGGVRSRDWYGVEIAIVVVAGLALLAWIMSLRRFLAMAGMPTSRVASAAQGYVELAGHCHNLPGTRVLSRLNLRACVWHQYVVEERIGRNKWKEVSSGRSEESFILDDGGDQCVIDPSHAEVIARTREVLIKDDIRYSEWIIFPKERIYVLGEFSTLGAEPVPLGAKRTVSELLTEWKRNQTQLLERFDLDKDGRISQKEWSLARSQAQREVRKMRNDIGPQTGIHLVHRPRDGRPFLISSVNPDKLANRYRFWAWAHLIVLLSAVAAAAWFSQPYLSRLFGR